MTETPRMPNFWWCPTHHLYRGGTERPCDDAVKLGDVETLSAELNEARVALRRYTIDEAEYEQACDALSARSKELVNLRAEIRALLEQRPERWGPCCSAFRDLRAIVDREPTTRCVNDTDGDGDCAACARNPNALCCQPITSESAVQP